MVDARSARRLRFLLAATVITMCAVLVALVGSLVIAARTDNGFMIVFITIAMAAVLVAEITFLGKLIILTTQARAARMLNDRGA